MTSLFLEMKVGMKLGKGNAFGKRKINILTFHVGDLYTSF